MTEPNGLIYMRERYYDASVGRFISEDPAGFGGGDVNLYAYVQNNPVMFIDPSGEFIHIVVGAIGGAIFGGVAGGIVAFVSTYIRPDGGGDLSSAFVSALTGAVSGSVVGAIAGGLTAAGLPNLGLSAAELAGSSLFGEGFIAGAISGETASVSGLAGTVVGTIATIIGPPVSETYDPHIGIQTGYYSNNKYNKVFAHL